MRGRAGPRRLWGDSLWNGPRELVLAPASPPSWLTGGEVRAVFPRVVLGGSWSLSSLGLLLGAVEWGGRDDRATPPPTVGAGGDRGRWASRKDPGLQAGFLSAAIAWVGKRNEKGH